MKATIVVGNPNPRSRTRQVAEALAQKLVQPSSDEQVIDLGDHAHQLFDWPVARIARLVVGVRSV